MSYHFGVGALYAIPTHEGDGDAVANPTPVQFGTMQEVMVDLSFDTKKLYGAKQFPLVLRCCSSRVKAKHSARE